MIPFKVFDKEKKELWMILNYHPGTSPSDDGSYLVAREADDDQDGVMKILPAKDIVNFKMVDFLDGEAE